jgi:hypothetical protein
MTEFYELSSWSRELLFWALNFLSIGVSSCYTPYYVVISFCSSNVFNLSGQGFCLLLLSKELTARFFSFFKYFSFTFRLGFCFGLLG